MQCGPAAERQAAAVRHKRDSTGVRSGG